MNTFDRSYECNYRVRWSAAEQGYVATVAEFPALQSSVAPTPFGAFRSLAAQVERQLLGS